MAEPKNKMLDTMEPPPLMQLRVKVLLSSGSGSMTPTKWHCIHFVSLIKTVSFLLNLRQIYVFVTQYLVSWWIFFHSCSIWIPHSNIDNANIQAYLTSVSYLTVPMKYLPLSLVSAGGSLKVPLSELLVRDDRLS